MKISILTLFPEMFQGPFDYSIIKNAKDKKLVDIEFVNIRDFGIGRHKIVDDKPYGGGVGMVLRVDVIDKAIAHAKCKKKECKESVILLDPQGQLFTQEKASKLARLDHVILICGHYEGVDERVKELVNEEVSIGDYVLTGGELPAMIVTDTIARLIPKVLKKQEATELETFSQNLLEYPQYTRPEEFKKSKVPKILLSGSHQKISLWRKGEAVKKTRKRRPDLLNSKLS